VGGRLPLDMLHEGFGVKQNLFKDWESNREAVAHHVR